jgi:hypothetical protein
VRGVSWRRAGALASWLESGGDLERDYLQVRGQPGSHSTVSKVWQTLPPREEQERQSKSVDIVLGPGPESEQKR